MSNNLLLKTQFLSVALGVVLLLSACQATKAITAIRSKKVKPQYASFEEKSIILTPLTHFGRPEFYDKLRDSVIHWKGDGYTVFYEKITSEQEFLEMDSASYRTLVRKFRRADGGKAGTPEDYEKEMQSVFKKGIGQPAYKELGLDSTDLNVDISLTDLVNKIEELYGEIVLDSCDYATSFDSTYSCFKGMKMKQLDPVYVDYRNGVVVDRIINSEYDKIVVLYGAMHMKGMKKMLKKEESARAQ